MSRAAPVPSRGGGRVWPIHADHGKGQSRYLASSNPSTFSIMSADLTVPRDTNGWIPGVVTQGSLRTGLSGGRRSGLGPSATKRLGAVRAEATGTSSIGAPRARHSSAEGA